VSNSEDTQEGLSVEYGATKMPLKYHILKLPWNVFDGYQHNVRPLVIANWLRRVYTQNFEGGTDQNGT